MLLIDPNAPGGAPHAAISEAESLIQLGGELVESHDWGQRRMAYEIDHRPEAEYRLYQFKGDNALLELNQRLRILDAVLRFRIIKAKPASPPRPRRSSSPRAAATTASPRTPAWPPAPPRTPRRPTRRRPERRADAPAPSARRRPAPRHGRQTPPPPPQPAAEPEPGDSAASPNKPLPFSNRPPQAPFRHSLDSHRAVIERTNRKGGPPHGRNQHQPGRAHREPHPRPRAALAAQRHLGLQPADRRSTPAARTGTPASGSTSPTTSTSPSGAHRARTAPSTSQKGRPVAVDGRLEWREWQDKEGNKRQSVDIIADSVQFLGSREGGENGGRGSRRRATSRRTPGTSSRRQRAPGDRTTTSRSDPEVASTQEGRRGEAARNQAPRATASAVVARAHPAAGGASRARSAGTRSTSSTTRTSRRCAGRSATRARSARRASPAPAAATSPSSPPRSSGPRAGVSCRTSGRR